MLSRRIPKGRDDERAMMLERVASNPLFELGYATEELRGDREVVMTAVGKNGWALKHATEELRGDRDMVMTAIAQEGWALQHATDELRGDREVVMTAIAQNGRALQYATEELRGDREVVMTAVAQDGWALAYATEELRGDCEVVMTAVAQKGYAVQHATDELRADKEIMEAALTTAAANGAMPIGLKARPNPACLLPFLLCVQGGGEVQQRLAHFWAGFQILLRGGVYFSLSGQNLERILLRRL